MLTTLTRLGLASLLAASLLFASGCGRSVESETRNWSNNKLELEKYASKYPGLKAAIHSHIATAQKLHDEANGISDPDAKANALGVANQKLQQVIKPFKALDDVMVDVAALKTDPLLLKQSAAKVNPAIKLADAGIAKAKSLLDGRGVDTSGALVGRVEEATRAATSGAAELLALKARIEAKAAKKQAKKAKKRAKEAEEAAKAAKAAPAPADGSPTPTPAPSDKATAPAGTPKN